MEVPKAVVTGAASGIGRALAHELAGRGASLVLADVDVDALHRVSEALEAPRGLEPRFAVNVGGIVNGLRAFVPRLLASQQPAHILITGSLAGVMTFPGGGAYGPAKHAVLAVAEHAAMALAGTQVTVSVVCPAFVSTGMSEEGVDPSEVAARALATVDDGTFAVMPDEWRNEVVNGAARLVAGHQPVAPAPEEPSRPAGLLVRNRRPMRISGPRQDCGPCHHRLALPRLV